MQGAAGRFFSAGLPAWRLVFVGDWVDELCDLTLDQIADALGERVGDVSREEFKS